MDLVKQALYIHKTIGLYVLFNAHKEKYVS